jgi:hypothetical protein
LVKRDFNVVVKNFDGSVIETQVLKTDRNGVHTVDEKGNMQFDRLEPVLLKKFLFDLLGGRMRGDDNISGAELMARYEVAGKIAAAGSGMTDLTDDDMRTITTVLEKGASPLIYGMTKKILSTDPDAPSA